MLSTGTGGGIVQLTLLVRLTLSCILVFAAVVKWRRKDDFAFLLGVLGRGWFERARSIRIVITASELVLGSLLFSGAWLEAASIATVMLFGSFLVVLTYAFKRGYVEDCTCFGDIGGNPVGTFHLVRNGILVLLSTFVAFEAWLRPSVASKFWRVPALSYVEACFLVIVTFACYALLNEVNAAVKRMRS